ncbi:MAG TPA: hypothetical protein VFZ58_05130 [Candidatus Saccharimonadales bacterium]
MNQFGQLSQEASELVSQLQAVHSDIAQMSQDTSGAVHVAGVGRKLYRAYEQLRNAAEYTEEHLLLRRAIERFLRRSLPFVARESQTQLLAGELIIELTQSGYLENDTVSYSTVRRLDHSIGEHAALFWELKRLRLQPDKAAKWILESVSVECERMLAPHYKDEVFASFAYKHFLQTIERKAFSEVKDERVYGMSLFAAVHRTLLKSDIAIVRYWLVRTSGQQFESPEAFVRLNKQVDEIYHSAAANRLGRLVRKYGAPIRILRGILVSSYDGTEAIHNHQQFASLIEQQIEFEYHATASKLKRGVLRSIAFIFITKMIIGLGLEVPYDIIILGGIVWLPLFINLLFPPLYMATIGWTIALPGANNSAAIKQHIMRLLYTNNQPPLYYTISRRVTGNVTTVFNVMYGLMFIISFSLLVIVLSALHFNVVQGAVFFIFLSTVSFLGFRLSQSVRELEMVDESQSFVNVISDFIYTPFVRVGQWLADKYSKINIVTFILDIAIELPLKTILRFIQQWVGFLKDKREEL